jgi:hypothetical protein
VGFGSVSGCQTPVDHAASNYFWQSGPWDFGRSAETAFGAEVVPGFFPPGLNGAGCRTRKLSL